MRRTERKCLWAELVYSEVCFLYMKKLCSKYVNVGMSVAACGVVQSLGSAQQLQLREGGFHVHPAS